MIISTFKILSVVTPDPPVVIWHIELKDWVTIAAIAASPVAAGFISWWLTIRWQNRKEKRDSKMRLFTTLMIHRKAYPISREWVGALNLITVVFADSPKVVEQWSKLYDSCQNRSETGEQRVHKQLELLSQMAIALGYSNLQQTDIDRYYTPEAHGQEVDLNTACQQEWYRVLKNTNHLLVGAIEKPKTVTDASIPPTSLT